jgi:hypothetical protein
MVSLLSVRVVLLGIFLMLLGIVCLRLRRLLLIALRCVVVRVVNSLFLILVLLRRQAVRLEEVDMHEDEKEVGASLMKKNPKMNPKFAKILAAKMASKKGKNGKKPLSAAEKKMGHRVGSAAHKRMAGKKDSY